MGRQPFHGKKASNFTKKTIISSPKDSSNILNLPNTKKNKSDDLFKNIMNKLPAVVRLNS